jgi:hypothetical protein
VALPHRVGRLRRKDCVLERDRGGKGWQLRMDRDHAVLFDHPTDHVPLMVMLEGFRQIGHLVTHEILESPGADREFVLAGMALDCFAFGELHETVDLVVEECEPVRESGDGCRLRIAALQNGTPLARADTTWVATRRYGGRTGALAG